MTNRDNLIFITGYLKAIGNAKKKIASKDLLVVKELILQRLETELRVFQNSMQHDTEPFTESEREMNDFRNFLMNGYDDDKDPDQQSPDFW